MKKVFRTIVGLIIVFLIYQFFVNFLITSKEYNYSVHSNNKEFLVNEIYKRKNHHNLYEFLIKDKNNNTFVYDYEGNLNRQSRIIKDIVYYNDSDLYCIAPVFKNNNIENIVCKYKGELVTYSYLKQIGNSKINEFINILNNSSYNVNKDYNSINDAKVNYGSISYYTDISDKIYFVLWKYNGVYVINTKKSTTLDVLSKDIYENDYGVRIGRYYLFYDNNPEYNSFYKVDILTGNSAHLEHNYEISKNIYINGVYKNKLYVTDLVGEKQYEINPNTEVIKQMDHAKYFDGKMLRTVDIDYFTNERKYFEKEKVNKNLSNYSNLVEANNKYYYIDNNIIYKVIGDKYNYKVKIATFDNISNLRAFNDSLYFISKDTIYMYNNKAGLKKVIENRELLYNNKNIYDVYEK